MIAALSSAGHLGWLSIRGHSEGR